MESTLAPKKTILVVEDEDILRSAMTLVFKASGYHVFSAANGTEALKIAQEKNLDVIVSDVRMPNGDGVELLKNIRALHFEKPVLFLVTGYTDLKSEDAYDLGADAIFAKPFDRQILLDTIAKKLLTPELRWQENMQADVSNLLQVRFPSKLGAQTTEGQIVKLGRGGFFAAMEQEIPHDGTSLKFSIHCSEQGSLILEGIGIVRWVRYQKTEFLPAGCGIEFQHIDSKCLETFLKILSSQTTPALIPKG